jgi:hypothetical protein
MKEEPTRPVPFPAKQNKLCSLPTELDANLRAPIKRTDRNETVLQICKYGSNARHSPHSGFRFIGIEWNFVESRNSDLFFIVFNTIRAKLRREGWNRSGAECSKGDKVTCVNVKHVRVVTALNYVYDVLHILYVHVLALQWCNIPVEDLFCSIPFWRWRLYYYFLCKWTNCVVHLHCRWRQRPLTSVVIVKSRVAKRVSGLSRNNLRRNKSNSPKYSSVVSSVAVVELQI